MSSNTLRRIRRARSTAGKQRHMAKLAVATKYEGGHRSATIALTPAEAEHVEWAFGAMFDYWGAACLPGRAPDPEAEGVTENDLTVPEGARMPFLHFGTLHLSTWHEVNDDLAYRVGEQLPMMAEDAVGQKDMSRQRAAGVARTCASLVDKVRAAST